MGCGSSGNTKWPEWIGSWERKKEEQYTVQLTIRNSNATMKYAASKIIYYEGSWSIDENNKELVFIATRKWNNNIPDVTFRSKEMKIPLDELEKGDFEDLNKSRHL